MQVTFLAQERGRLLGLMNILAIHSHYDSFNSQYRLGGPIVNLGRSKIALSRKETNTRSPLVATSDDTGLKVSAPLCC